MVRHVCLIKYKDPAAVDAAAQAKINEAYLKLPAIIDGIASIKVGRDLGLLDGNYDFAIQAEFRDREAFLAYSVHPAHGEIVFPALGHFMESYSTAQF
jgi:hypothetical protein